MRFTPRPSGWPNPLAAALVLLLAGCAGVQPAPPRVERLSAAEVEARLPQPASAISLADIVAMGRAGTTPEEIIRRIDAAHARYRLSATKLLELQREGVALAVLDHMVEAERRAIFESVAADLAKRELACQARIEQEARQCRLQAMPLLWPHPFANCWPPFPGHPFWRCF